MSSFSEAAVPSPDPANSVACPQAGVFPSLGLSFFICKSGIGLHCQGPLQV